MLRFLAKVERDRAEAPFAGADGKEILVEPRLAMSVEQPSGPLRAMPPDKKVTSLGVAHQCADACLVERDIDRIEAADNFIGDSAGILFAADTRVAAQLPMAGEPPKKQDGDNRACQFQQLCRHEARPLNKSIIAVTGLRSYPASAACSLSTAGCSPFDARASAHNKVDRVPERQ